MPIVENETEEEIEYRVNDDGGEGDGFEKIGPGQCFHFEDYAGERFHEIRHNDDEIVPVKNSTNAQRLPSRLDVVIRADGSALFVNRGDEKCPKCKKPRKARPAQVA